MKPDQMPFLVPGQVAYFDIDKARTIAVKVFGIAPPRSGPMVCVNVVGTVCLWAPLTYSTEVPRIPLHPMDWEDARLVKLRTSSVSLLSAFLFRRREIPKVSILDDFEGPRPILGEAKMLEVRRLVEAEHKVVWKDPPARTLPPHVTGRDPIWRRAER